MVRFSDNWFIAMNWSHFGPVIMWLFNYGSGFQMVEAFWQPSCFSHYSEPPNTGLSGIGMVIFWTLLKSGFRMVLAAILCLQFENQTFLIASGQYCRTGHLKTGHKKCPKNDHSNTGRSGIRWVTVQSSADIRTPDIRKVLISGHF
jgi:hypothetical protein